MSTTSTEPIEGDLQVSFTRERATAIIEAAGWRVATGSTRRGSFDYYVRPGGKDRRQDGRPGVDYVWGLDEALADALSTTEDERCAGVAA